MHNNFRGLSMVQCGRDISPKELKEICETVKVFCNLSRTEIAQTICEHLDWFVPSGGSKLDACIKLLEKLEAMGHIQLPEKRTPPTPRDPKKSAIRKTKRTAPQPELVGKLKEFDPIELEVVTEKDRVALWKEYVHRYHYLGYSKPFGCYLRYFIKSGSSILGCALFAGAAKSMGVRDNWIGWTSKQRLNNLPWVVNNSRFVFFPWVTIPHLGSHVLGHIGRRIKSDWEKQWGYGPLLMETFVNPEQYQGIIYKASNWEQLGRTTGEGLARIGKSYKTTPKLIFVKPLAMNFKRQLSSETLVGKKK